MAIKSLMAIRLFLAQAGITAAFLVFLFGETIADFSQNNPEGIVSAVAYLGIFTVRALTVLLPSMVLTSALVGLFGRRGLAFFLGVILLNAILIFSIEYVAIVEKDFSGILQKAFTYSLSWCAIFFLSLFIVGNEGRKA